MRVLFVASECGPLIKTGGLADVVWSLPRALGSAGVEARIMMPAYPGVAARLEGAESREIGDVFGYSARLITGTVAERSMILLDAPGLFDRPGNPYTDPDGADWADNHSRFAALGLAAAAVALDGIGGWVPDAVHAHDWQAGLVPVYLRHAGRASPPTAITIHNVAFQGLFPATALSALHLPAESFHPEGIEFHGQIGFLKGGLAYADRITTVSPTYARELMTPEFGMGLEGMLRHRRRDLVGILNGADLEIWDPGTDAALPAIYSVSNRTGKTKNRKALAERYGLELSEDRPLFCVISRLTEQKGLDILLQVLPHLVETGARLAVLGSGDKVLEEGFAAAAAQHPGRIGVEIGYDEELAHLLQAGSDAIVVPSRFEPCGLTQLYGLRYGTLPVVGRTGGLADTIIDANPAAIRAGVATGFQFAPVEQEPLRAVIDRVCAAYADRALWQRMMVSAMRQPVGWDEAALAYRALYQDLVKGTAEL
ncbi:MAG: glycogen synthase GlgA [Pseudomonadota bacterium]